MKSGVLRAVAVTAVLAGTAVAQEEIAADGTGASLRALDKLTGQVQDIVLADGETTSVGRIEITLGQCRFPEGNPAGDAYAYVTVREIGVPDPVFKGWMLASSPALNAMDHPRYDVWVLRCTTS